MSACLDTEFAHKESIVRSAVIVSRDGACEDISVVFLLSNGIVLDVPLFQIKDTSKWSSVG